MSKKDYQAIARAIHATRPDPSPRLDGPAIHPLMTDVWEKTRNAIADVLAADSPRFDRARFMEACETGRCKGMR